MRSSRSRTGRIWWWVIALLLVAWAAVPPGPALAQDGEATSAAGFIVDTGEGEPRYVVVTFSEPELTAVELLRKADLDAVTVDFGGLGEGVCSIDRTGCDVSACRQRLCQTGDPESPFWQYWEQDQDDGWSLSPRGASHAEVADGDIAAWVWTGVKPSLEPISWAELAERAGAPAAVVAGDISNEPTIYTSGTSGGGSAGDAAGTAASVAVIALLGLAGGWLVWRQRHRAAVQP